MSTHLTRPRARVALMTPSRQFAQIAALGTILLLSSRVQVVQQITLGQAAALLLAPLWISYFKRYTGGRWLMWGGIAASVSSVWLTLMSAADHETAVVNLVTVTGVIAGAVIGVGVLLWARSLLPVWLIGAVYGAGMFIAVFTHQAVIGYNAGSGGQINPWKFSFAVPLAILALSLAWRAQRKWVEIAVLLALALVSAKLDSRSYFGEFLVAALLVLWQVLPKGRGKPSAVRVLVFFAIVMAAMYNIGTSLILGGALGEETQARSLQDVERAGSIIVGSRPEMGASVALFLSRPFGFGGGTFASSNDILTAQNGMTQIGYDPENGYVYNFLFGDKIEVHSSLGDLWVYAGLAGIAFTLILAVLLCVIIGRRLADRTASAVVLFVVVQSFWNIFFQPWVSAQPIWVVALGLGLTVKAALPKSPAVDREMNESENVAV